jgi:two-component system sensor histidine kinase KdpD
MTALVVAGGVLSAQSVRRELRVADLKSSLVAAVSHEFRTPLTLLRQTTEALADGRVSDAPTQHRYYYRQLRATDRLQRLVEGMLDFARLEAGAFELSAEAFNAGDWVAAVTEAFNSEVEGNVAQVRLEATVPDVDIHADREALTRVLWNLMDNAVKHSPAGTPVNVRVLQEADGMAVEVRDRGPGVDPGERDAIFDRFARGRQAAGRAQGTGLGLALAREIARAHGGDVTVRGRPGGGSIFTLSLPLGGHG